MPRVARYLLLVLGAAAIAAARGADGQPAQEFGFAFWNVENLFDAEDDPDNGGDDQYLPGSGWTEARYRLKLDRLAEVIAAVAPHVCGLAEVENRRVLDDLRAHPRLAGLGFEVAHSDSADGRGIDTALLFRAPFRLVGDRRAIRLHPVDKEGRRASRGIIEVPLAVGDAELTVLVNHWPSRVSDRDGSYRQVAGSTARAIVDGVVEAHERRGLDADVLLIGDLNDNPWDASVTRSLGAVRSRNAVLHRRKVQHLFNPSWALLAEPDRGTIYYNREWTWSVFDQAVVTKGMLDERGFGYVEGSLDIWAPAALRDQHGRPLRFHRRGDRWLEGYSDHFLIHGRLRLDTTASEGD